jgi:uncharacterized membrane protein
VKPIFAAYVVALALFCLCDFAWLGFIARGFYQNEIGPLLLDRPRWTAAIVFYPLYIAGVMFFCVAPALSEGGWARALVNGLALGLLAYATYDLSNLATLKGWSVALVVVDVLWGMAVTAVAACAGYAAARAL